MSLKFEYSYGVQIRAGDQRVAIGQTVQVYVDPETGKLKRIPDRHRDQLRGTQSGYLVLDRDTL